MLALSRRICFKILYTMPLCPKYHCRRANLSEDSGRKDRLMKRRLTKTSSVAPPTDVILENKESEKGDNTPEPEKEGLKAKLLRRKNKKASDSAAPDSPIPEAKFEQTNYTESDTLTETPTSTGGKEGLKAKLQRRKNKQAAELASQEPAHQSEEMEQDEY